MTLWAVDSHVHFHKCFDEGLFFDSCIDNLRKITSSQIKNGILFFTEGKNEDFFNYLKSKTKIESSSNKSVIYVVSQIDNGNAIDIRWIDTGIRIIVFPGFQIVTKEYLEVLSLGTKERISDGASIEETIADVISIGGIPVLPWGFGKWYGDRGKKIDEMIRKKIPPLFLGDNGGRNSLLSFPVQFETAQMNGIKIFPGSDPLPFPDEQLRAMSYGFIIVTEIDESNPWGCIKETLLDADLKIEKFGRLTPPWSFIKNQLAMQIKKRKNK